MPQLHELPLDVLSLIGTRFFATNDKDYMALAMTSRRLYEYYTQQNLLKNHAPFFYILRHHSYFFNKEITAQLLKDKDELLALPEGSSAAQKKTTINTIRNRIIKIITSFQPAYDVEQLPDIRYLINFFVPSRVRILEKMEADKKSNEKMLKETQKKLLTTKKSLHELDKNSDDYRNLVILTDAIANMPMRDYHRVEDEMACCCQCATAFAFIGGTLYLILVSTLLKNNYIFLGIAPLSILFVILCVRLGRDPRSSDYRNLSINKLQPAHRDSLNAIIASFPHEFSNVQLRIIRDIENKLREIYSRPSELLSELKAECERLLVDTDLALQFHTNHKSRFRLFDDRINSATNKSQFDRNVNMFFTRASQEINQHRNVRRPSELRITIEEVAPNERTRLLSPAA